MSNTAFITSKVAASLVNADMTAAHFKQPVQDDFSAIVDTLKQAGVASASETASNTIPNTTTNEQTRNA